MFRWAGIFLLVSVPVALTYGWLWVVVAIPASIVLGFIVGEYLHRSPKPHVKAALREMNHKQKLFDERWRLPLLTRTIFDAKSGEIIVDLSDGARFVADATMLGLAFKNGIWIWVWEFEHDRWKLPEQVLRYREPARSGQLRRTLEELHERTLYDEGVFLSAIRNPLWDNATTTIDYYEAKCATVIESVGRVRIFERVGEELFQISVLLNNPRWSSIRTSAVLIG